MHVLHCYGIIGWLVGAGCWVQLTMNINITVNSLEKQAARLLLSALNH